MAVKEPTHLCPCCDRVVPHAAGHGVYSFYTLGTAHVDEQDHEPCAGGNYTKYGDVDQLRNLEELLEGPVINDGTFLIGPGLGGSGPNPGPPRDLTDDGWTGWNCVDCGRTGHPFCGRS